MEEKTPKLDLRDIPEVEKFIPHPALPWWAWLTIALFVVALILFLVRLARCKTATAESIRAKAYHEAMTALEKARNIQNPVTLATTVSLTIRHYLALAFSDSSLFETHEEFLSRHDALAHLPEPTRQQIGTHFQQLARLKYAPVEESRDLSGLIPQAIELIDHLHVIKI